MAKLREKKPFTLNQQGFTMIELMIALVIGLALMAGIFSVFLMTKETQNFTTAMSRVQDSARFSLDYLWRLVSGSIDIYCRKIGQNID